jgi:hypothetical protein
MNEPTIQQVGDWPKYDKDLGTCNRSLGRNIKKQVLLGNFDSEPGSGDAEMILAYKSSKLNVDEFLDTWKR